ncbi:MAG: hypothetical protein M3R70_13040 [Actinomycetota bacterium]|nr:hypothetical protein [Actinomycetota bacterium]
MDVRIENSNGRLVRNDRARFSVLVGVLALASVPAGIEAAKAWKWVSLTHAVAGIAVISTLFGLLAILLARGARRNVELTLGRIGGWGAARLGRLLGVVAVFLGLSAACALGFYGLLLIFGSS